MWITLFVAFQAATNQLECLSDTVCMFKRLWHTVSTDGNKVLYSACLCLHLSNTGHRPGDQTITSQVFISLNELCSHKTSPQSTVVFWKWSVDRLQRLHIRQMLIMAAISI